MSETEKPARHLAQADIKLMNVEALFPSAKDTFQLKVGDMISFGVYDKGVKKADLATALITEFRSHPDKTIDKNLSLPIFRIMYENVNYLDGFMVKAEPGFLLFEDKEQIRVISHMLIAHEAKNWTVYHPIKTEMDRKSFEESFSKMFNEGLLEVEEKEIVDTAFIGIEYIRS